MICSFADYLESEHKELCGGKGSLLARLFQNNYPVPDGFIILSSAFDDRGLKQAAWETVSACYSTLVDGDSITKVAVRSSAAAEDSSTASFAGGFDSVLNVGSLEDLRSAIDTVFDSRASARVSAYSVAVGHNVEHQMAIVVQQMVDADFSGVLFTLDPVSLSQTRMAGNYVDGLGDSLVSGTAMPKVFSYDRQTGEYSGPDELAGVESTLFDLTSRLEKDLGGPQDIEWAVRDSQVFILQSRPITTLSVTPEVWNDTLQGDYLWTTTNYGEAFTGVLTPYSWSYYQALFDVLSLPRGQPLIGLIAGRVYANITLILSIAGRLGFKPRPVLDFLEQALGKFPEEIEAPVEKIPWLDFFGFLATYVKVATLSLYYSFRHFKWLTTDGNAWSKEQRLYVATIESKPALLAHYQEISKIPERGFFVLAPVTNNFMMKQNALRRTIEDWLEPDQVETLLSGLGGKEQLESLGLMMSLEQLTRGEISTEEFNDLYGHRSANELEFAAKRSAEDENWIDTMKSHLRSNSTNTADLLEEQERKRHKIWSDLVLEHPRKAKKLQRAFDKCADLARRREQIRSSLVRYVWLERTWVQKAGSLCGIDDDIFYLTRSEVFALLEGDESVIDHIEPRKLTLKKYETLPPLPVLISGQIEPFEWAKSPTRRTDFYDSHKSHNYEDSDLVTGFPGAIGVVEGRVRRLDSRDQANELLEGEILVTSFTNVGWTPLFPRAAAVVTDIGAPLSHAAIVARELGIPAVVGTGNATMKLKTGDLVRVDGSAGVVELIS